MTVPHDLHRNEITENQFLSPSGHPIELRTIDGTQQQVLFKVLDPDHEPYLPRRFDFRQKTRGQFATAPGVVPVLESGVTETGDQYVATPYYPLGSLDDQIDHGPMPWQQAVRLILKTTQTVVAAHEQGIVLDHIRPSRILLADPDTPLLAVVGMPKRRPYSTDPFAAPEAQYGGRPAPSADVYALTMTLGCIIAGKRPDLGEPHRILLDVASLAPQAIYDLVDYGISYNPANRFGSASLLANSLSGFVPAVDQPQHRLTSPNLLDGRTTTPGPAAFPVGLFDQIGDLAARGEHEITAPISIISVDDTAANDADDPQVDSGPSQSTPSLIDATNLAALTAEIHPHDGQADDWLHDESRPTQSAVPDEFTPEGPNPLDKPSPDAKRGNKVSVLGLAAMVASVGVIIFLAAAGNNTAQYQHDQAEGTSELPKGTQGAEQVASPNTQTQSASLDSRETAQSASPSLSSESPAQGAEPTAPDSPSLISEATAKEVSRDSANIRVNSTTCVTITFEWSWSSQTSSIDGGPTCSQSHSLLLGSVTEPLVPGTTYVVNATVLASDGRSDDTVVRFTTLD